jgi:hypothetical protein
VVWWWVWWESAVARSGNLLLCLRVAVAGGARWAKMTEWVSFSAFKLLPPCSIKSRATCHFVVNVSILVQIKQRGLPLWKYSSVQAKERSMRSVCATTGHVFSFFSKETAKGPDQNRYGREGAQGSKGSISVATQQHKQKQKLTRSKWMRASHVGLPHENIKTRRKKLDCT